MNLFNKLIIDIINERISVRSFIRDPLNPEIKEKILNLIESPNLYSPFSEVAGRLRFKLLNLVEINLKQGTTVKRVGGILGAQDFIVGAIEKSEYNFEHYGYVLESIILKLTEFELSTCWLGSFDRKLFSNDIQKRNDEIMPAITAVGVVKRRRNLPRIRIPIEQFFFDGDFTNPIKTPRNDKLSRTLEMVRIGPSASNLQPWRIVKDRYNEKALHFYTLSTKDRTGRMYNNFRRIDIGIAVCHFDLASNFFKLKGRWEFNQPSIPNTEGLRYIISWNETE